VFSLSNVRAATRRALASKALQPIETETTVQDDGGARFVLRAASSLARKESERDAGGAGHDPLGDYEPDLFVADVSPTHYALLNKFSVIDGHVLLVRRRFEPQEQLLAVEDFDALSRCLDEVDGLGFYNGGTGAGASQPRKHLQLVPLPLAPEIGAEVPTEPLLAAGSSLPFRHAFRRIGRQRSAAALHATYRELLDACGISAVAAAEGELHSAPYNLLVRRGWMVVVPRSRERFESISVNALGFAGSLFVRTREELERVRRLGPMQVLRAVALPGRRHGRRGARRVTRP
jgi:sulfate adenylyltransferase (ADP) / ATP adenylyltransferase